MKVSKEGGNRTCEKSSKRKASLDSPQQGRRQPRQNIKEKAEKRKRCQE